MLNSESSLGASFHSVFDGRGTCDFLVWAPNARKVDLCLLAPDSKKISMTAALNGCFFASVPNVASETLYHYRLSPVSDDNMNAVPLERADPASRYQPQGVHGPSRVVPDSFVWHDDGWENHALNQYIIYELHVGVATPEGTFEALLPLLSELNDLGVTAVELMPVGEFPGERNWGYDGVFPFAVHHAYGGPDGLKRFVDACHRSDLAVIMDVVYNHLGPEGNYLDDFGPYFTDAYTTPWGRAVNFDGPYSDHVRRYFLENARYWICDCHVDALRVDAVHGIYDFSARPFLGELTQLVLDEARRLNRRIYCIAESDLNDPKVIRPPEQGGLAFDAQWNDDFHHALHSLLTGEQNGYYADFGRLEDFAGAWQRNYVYDGRYSAYRRRRHGNDARNQPPDRFVVFSQNHDQVGNRMQGERLSALAGFEQLKLAAACVLLSPFIPLLFMGEEYGEPAPFLYFVSHSDPDLVEAVRMGRRREFREFQWKGEPPDPQAPETFRYCIPNPSLRQQDSPHTALYSFYREAIHLRKELPALSHLHRDRMRVDACEEDRLLGVLRRHRESSVYMVFHFGARAVEREVKLPGGRWRKILDTSELRWRGPGSRVPVSEIGGGSSRMWLSPWQAVLWDATPG